MDRYFDDFEIGERFRSTGASIKYVLTGPNREWPAYLRYRLAHVSSRGLVQGVQYGLTRGGRVTLDSAREAGRYDIYGGRRT